FTFWNTIQNLTMQFYNWTSGCFTPLNDSVVFYSSEMKSHTGIKLTDYFSSLLDLFEEKNGSLRINIVANAKLPILENNFTWTLDRLKINITYMYFCRNNWSESIFNATNERVFHQATSTIFESPMNNYSTCINVSDFIDFCDNYTYELMWNNATDLGLVQVNFSVDRIQTNLVLVSGFTTDFKLVGEIVRPTVKLSVNATGDPMPGEQVMFTVLFSYRNGSNQIREFNALTDEDGFASVSIELTSELYSLGFNATFKSLDPNYKDSEYEHSFDIRVLTSDEHARLVILNNLHYIIIGIVALCTMIVVQRFMHVKRRKRWLDDANRVQELVKIQYILAIFKESGTCVVNRSYSRLEFDEDLVSGFVTAIASFGKEIGANDEDDQKKRREIIFDYDKFKIIIQDGEYIRIALILDEQPTEFLKSKLKEFVTEFESKYALSSWKGNLTIFRDVDLLIEKVFEVSLIFPLVINPDISKTRIKSRLGKALYEIASQIQKEKGVFFIGTLLGYAQAGRRKSKEHVLSEIYQMKKAGIFKVHEDLKNMGVNGENAGDECKEK
ncbi:MAG: hypothetical protein ACTSXP_07325, partial [Promethearchaeota archaeon]